MKCGTRREDAERIREEMAEAAKKKEKSNDLEDFYGDGKGEKRREG